MKLILEEVNEANREMLATLEDRSYILGRELTVDIPIASTALSRQHGMFLHFVSGWGYKDLGSTNGSWLNKDKLEPHRLVVLRDGDYIQVADRMLRVRCVEDIDAHCHDGFRLFAVGENNQTVELDPKAFDGTIVTEFGFIFELKDGSLFIELEDENAEVTVNETRVTGPVQLLAGDRVKGGPLEFVVVFGALARPAPKARRVEVPSRASVRNDLIDVAENQKKTDDFDDAREFQDPRNRVYSPTPTSVIDQNRLDSMRAEEGETESELNLRAPAPFRSQFIKDSEDNWFDFDRYTDAEKFALYGIAFFILASFIILLIFLFR